MEENNIKNNVIDYVIDKLESIYYDGVHEFEFSIVDAVMVVEKDINVYIALIDAQDFASSYDMSESDITDSLTDLFSKDEYSIDGKNVKVTFEIDDWDYEEEWLKKQIMEFI